MNLFPVLMLMAGAAVVAVVFFVLRWLVPRVRRLGRRAQLVTGALAWVLVALVFAVTLVLVSGSFLPQTVLDPGVLNRTWIEVSIAIGLLAALILLARLWTVPSLADAGLESPTTGRALGDFGFGLLLGPLAAGIIPIAGIIGGWDQVIGMAALPDLAVGLGIGALFFLATALFEELLYRGWLLALLARLVGLPVAVILSLLVFSLLHGLNPGASVLAVVGVAVAAVVLTLGLLRTGSLWLPIGFHAGWNWALGNLYGYAVSGIGLTGALQHGIDPSAPAWATGGDFGPEASLFGIVAFALAGAATWAYTRRRDGIRRLFPSGTPEHGVPSSVAQPLPLA